MKDGFGVRGRPRSAAAPSAVVPLAALMAFALVACSEGHDPAEIRGAEALCSDFALPPERAATSGTARYANWTPPARPSLRLLDEEPRVEARGLGEASEGRIAAFAARDLEVLPDTDGGLRLRSPALPAPAPDGDAGSRSEARIPAEILVRLRPGGLERFHIVPRTSLDGGIAFDARMRRIDVAVSSELPQSEVTTFRVQLGAALGSNWQDEQRQPVLRQLELRFGAPLPPGFGVEAVEELIVLSDRARYADRAASVQRVERGATLRRALALNAGVSASFRVKVPASVDVPGSAEAPADGEGGGAPRLVWHDSALGTAKRSVRVVEGGGSPGDALEAVSLSQVEDAGPTWTRRSVSLARWAGREVRIEFEAESGGGVAFFAEPRIVESSVGDRHANVPDVLFFVADTLRADRVGFYARGAEPALDADPALLPHTPALDGLARAGVVFARTVAASPWTKPSIPTLMTGLLPTTHRVGAVSYTDRLPEGVPLLQERFARAGWRTASFAANPLGSALSGLDRGFDAAFPPSHWRERLRGESGDSVRAEWLREAFEAWVAEEPNAPFFAYLHAIEPHEYAKPPFVRGAGSAAEAYARAVRALDREIGSLVTWIEAHKRRTGRDLLVAFVSDHGESFGDHDDPGHGTSLFQSQLHVPFFLWAGDALPSLTSHALVSTADLAPTILELAGLPPLESTREGRSLLPIVAGTETRVRDRAHAARIRYVWEPDAPSWYALVDASLRKVVDDGVTKREYDLARDPCERRPLGGAPRLARELASSREMQEERAQDFEAALGRPREAQLDPRDLEALRALGYLE